MYHVVLCPTLTYLCFMSQTDGKCYAFYLRLVTLLSQTGGAMLCSRLMTLCFMSQTHDTMLYVPDSWHYALYPRLMTLCFMSQTHDTMLYVPDWWHDFSFRVTLSHTVFAVSHTDETVLLLCPTLMTLCSAMPVCTVSNLWTIQVPYSWHFSMSRTLRYALLCPRLMPSYKACCAKSQADDTLLACPLLFILFSCLFLSLWPFRLYFIP